MTIQNTVLFAVLLLTFQLSKPSTAVADDEVSAKRKLASQMELTDQEFRKLHAELQPKPDEPWRTIPWKISLLDAQRVAAETKKPLFIWAMDGHPLGCT